MNIQSEGGDTINLYTNGLTRGWGDKRRATVTNILSSSSPISSFGALKYLRENDTETVLILSKVTPL